MWAQEVHTRVGPDTSGVLDPPDQCPSEFILSCSSQFHVGSHLSSVDKNASVCILPQNFLQHYRNFQLLLINDSGKERFNEPKENQQCGEPVYEYSNFCWPKILGGVMSTSQKMLEELTPVFHINYTNRAPFNLRVLLTNLSSFSLFLFLSLKLKELTVS
jgi:hypothetical protein